MNIAILPADPRDQPAGSHRFELELGPMPRGASVVTPSAAEYHQRVAERLAWRRALQPEECA